jgi:hypothetical protein
MKTDFSQIVFDAEKHRYYLDGKELTGVTKYLSQFQVPFDRESAALRVANREVRSVDSILAEWNANYKASIELGIKVHQHIKDTLDDKLSFTDPFLSFNDEIPEIQAFNRVWSRFKDAVEVISKEWIVGDADLGMAGTIDLFLFSHVTGQCHIWDWKTGKFDTSNQWQNLLPPFHNFDASKLNIYSLQISLYRLIVERNTYDMNLGDSYIVHLSADGLAYIHKAVDFRPQLIEYFQ